MTKLITADEAKEMREKSIKDFNEKGMVMVIKHLNKKIKEASSGGLWGIEIFYIPYMELECDKILGELSSGQIKEVIKHLEDNGYRAWTYGHAFYIRWDNIQEQEPKPQENSWYTKYTIWR